MKKINSGKYPFMGNKMNCQRVAAGIRQNPIEYIGRIPQETIFVACVGVDGSYRDAEAVEKISNILGFVEYQHVIPDEENKNLHEAFYLNDIDDHRSRWSSLIQYADIVFPDPVDEDDKEEAPPKPEKKTAGPF